MKPMLAFKYQDRRDRIVYPCYVQAKLNGVRMLYRAGCCQSRDEHLWHDSMLDPIRHALVDLDEAWILDGELYVHGWSLQQINAAASVNRISPSPKTARVQYHIFDGFLADNLLMPFNERIDWLFRAVYPLTVGTIALSLVTTQYVTSLSEADQHYRTFKNGGYEGMMYRDASAPYGFSMNCTNKENRWGCLLKRKDWLDDEFVIVNVELGMGKYANVVGSLVLCTSDGIMFCAGSGLSDIERHEYMDNPPIGRLARIRYEVLSDGGIPLKPTIEAIL